MYGVLRSSPVPGSRKSRSARTKMCRWGTRPPVRADTTWALFGAVPIVHAAPAERGEAKDGADGNEEGGTVGPAAMCVPLYGGRVQDHSTLRSPGGIGLSARCHAEGRTVGTEKRRDRRVVAAVMNVRGLPYVIPDSMPPTGEESDEQTSAYQKEDERRGSETGPRGRRPTAAGRWGERRLPHPGRRW